MTIIPRDRIETALDTGSLAIRVGRFWVSAARAGSTIVCGDNWVIPVRGGSAQRRAIITNIDNNVSGRDFAFVGDGRSA